GIGRLGLAAEGPAGGEGAIDGVRGHCGLRKRLQAHAIGRMRRRRNKKADPKARFSVFETRRDQRLENWKLRRALARPYFFRSTVRLSRVRKPPFFSTARKLGS